MSANSSQKNLHTKLGELASTAICGNDILSSALYVSGIAIIFAGVYAPLVLLLIVLVLFFYKSVYTEVVESLPVNGGAYNCLLNSTSKPLASIAGVMTILSYVATAVISAKVGIEYFGRVFHIDVFWGTIGLLFLFALLVISGIKDSSRVAIGIFIFHILALGSFLVSGVLAYFAHGGSHFFANLAHTGDTILANEGIGMTLFFAFSASLLGVSGFESSANFVEEQRRGVFRKTLRNMIIGVGIFNPLIALVVLNVLPYDTIAAAKDFLLADAAAALGGRAFEIFISIDALLVLSGAVLTSFVGVSGLASRMASDGCLPNFLSHTNSRDSHDRIIIAFFLLCASILYMTGGDLLSLAGVYTISFLGVMSLFALGNLVMRHTRTELKRTYHAPLVFTVLAFFATLIGIAGNIKLNPANFRYFLIYFLPTLGIVLSVIYQDYVVGFFLRVFGKVPLISNYLKTHFEALISGRFIVFVHHIERLQSILDYVNRNEAGREIVLVHCLDQSYSSEENEAYFQKLLGVITSIKAAGFYAHLSISAVSYAKPFSPELVSEVAHRYHMPKNRILIGSIHHEHDFDYDDLGGVRIIF